MAKKTDTDPNEPTTTTTAKPASKEPEKEAKEPSKTEAYLLDRIAKLEERMGLPATPKHEEKSSCLCPFCLFEEKK